MIQNIKKQMQKSLQDMKDSIQKVEGKFSIEFSNHINGGTTLNLDTSNTIAQITIWPSGSVDTILLDVDSGSDVTNTTTIIKEQFLLEKQIKQFIDSVIERRISRNKKEP